MTIKHVILSGGGIKGITMLGVMHYLSKRKIINFDCVSSIAGSSVGALIGSLISIGYSPYQLYHEYKVMNFGSLLEPNISNLFKYYGLDTGYKLVAYIHKMFKGRGLNENITFQQHFETTGIHLILTGTNVNLRKTEYFDYVHTPNTKVSDAIRISLSFPFYFTSPKFKECYYVDGGVLDNFPIHLFHNAPSHEILAIKIKKVRDQTLSTSPVNIPQINDFETWLYSLVCCFLEEIEYLKATTNHTTYFHSTIFVEETEVAIMDLNISEERYEKLFQKGIETAKEYINTFTSGYFKLRYERLPDHIKNRVCLLVQKT